MTPPLVDRPEQWEKLRPRLFAGETVDAVLGARRDIKGESMGFLAITSQRLVVYDERFGGTMAAFLSIPYAQVTAVAAQDEEVPTAGRNRFSRLVLATHSGSEEFVLDYPDHARRAHDLILPRVLYPPSVVSAWVTVLRMADAILQRIAPDRAPLAETAILDEARHAAATGRDPNDVLAEVLALVRVPSAGNATDAAP